LPISFKLWISSSVFAIIILHHHFFTLYLLLFVLEDCLFILTYSFPFFKRHFSKQAINRKKYGNDRFNRL
jgi:hypothetical protein